ncbi:hypothetical protein [Thalassoroseus pseudoceratinae]|uniref:hypothetical protein n=1 Tax=Thalassoroseus pseudoceratinae TaxID=2713176 RepID=UPI00141DF25C|nr:hypothetical protein [Thalassoroseus pseudoceratinae]
MTLHFNPIWSWSSVLLTAVGLIALVLRTYPPRIRHLPPLWRRSLLSLRLLVALVLILAMFRPELRQQDDNDDDERHVMLVLSDASRSMQTRDIAGGASRRESVQQTLQSVDGLFTNLEEIVDVRFFDFAENLQPTETVTTDAKGQQTAIGYVLEEALNTVDREDLAAILVLSDGTQRALPPNDVDPRRIAEQIAGHPVRRVPVSTIGFGSEVLEGASDLAVEEVNVASEVFVKTTVPVTGRIRTTGAAGRTLTVRVLLEDRSGKQPGETGELKEIPATSTSRPVMQLKPRSNAEMIPFELSFVPPQAGEYKLAVQVEELEGELKTTNNQRATIINVSKGGLKIAYFDKPYWEQKYIRLAGSSKKIDIDFFAIRPTPFSNQNKLDPTIFQDQGAENYDAYIIGDVPREVFGDENLQQLADRVRSGAGLLMLGGFNTLGPGGYAGSALEPLLPVDLRADTDAAHYLEDLPMRPTREGVNHFVMRLGAADSQRAWAKLPALQSGNRLREKNAAVQVLAATNPDYPRAGIPLLFTQDVGGARVMTFAGDTTWQWVMAGEEEPHQQFWRQMLLYLTHKELDADQPVWAMSRARRVFPGQPVELEFGARTATGEPIPDASFTVRVLPPADEDGNTTERKVTPRRTADTHTATVRETSPSGDHWVRVSAEKDGQSLGPDAWTRYLVESRDLELDNPSANPELLREISQTTGGRFLTPEELPGYLQDLIANPPQSLAEQVQSTRLWDNWWFLLAFVGLLTLEWALRKKRGLV